MQEIQHPSINPLQANDWQGTLISNTVSLDYIPEPTSSIPIKKPPAAGTSTLEVMADVHQRFGNVDSGSGEVEVLERTQEGNQATQF